LSLLFNQGVPTVMCLLVAKDFQPNRSRPEQIQVMNFPEKVLQLLQVLSPALMKARKEIFYGIPESFEADAQAMVTGFRAIPQDHAVEQTRLLPALKREMPKNQTTWLQPVRSRR
jgi:hypothetical protein